MSDGTFFVIDKEISIKTEKIVGIFGFIFIILPIILLLIVLGIGVTLVRNILRVFGWGGSSRWGQYTGGQAASGRTEQPGTGRQTTSASPQVKKVIGDDEGEYVEFEEVK